MLRGSLEEQVILRGKRFRVHETEGHGQHECSEVNQKTIAVSRVHAILRRGGVTFRGSCCGTRFIHKLGIGESHGRGREGVFRCSPIWEALILMQNQRTGRIAKPAAEPAKADLLSRK